MALSMGVLASTSQDSAEAELDSKPILLLSAIKGNRRPLRQTTLTGKTHASCGQGRPSVSHQLAETEVAPLLFVMNLCYYNIVLRFLNKGAVNESTEEKYTEEGS